MDIISRFPNILEWILIGIKLKISEQKDWGCSEQAYLRASILLYSDCSATALRNLMMQDRLAECKEGSSRVQRTRPRSLASLSLILVQL